MSYLLRGLAADGGVRVVAADTTDLVREVVSRHGASRTAGAAIGRAVTACLLLSHVLLKDPSDRVTLRVRGDGPLGAVVAEGGLDGTARGYAQYPQASLPLRDDGKLDVGAAVGEGDLLVVRSHAPHGDPYASSVELVSGEIAEDVAMFLARSEQIPSAVLLGVYFGVDGQVEQAGGVILQALPGAADAALAVLEANVREFGALTTAMQRAPLEQLVSEELAWGLGYERVTGEPLPLTFACRCSDDKALAALTYFPPEERQEMIREDGGAEVVCHWCGEKRWVSPDQIRSLGAGEVRCPDCNALWYKEGDVAMVHDGQLCACGRSIDLPN